MSTEIKFIPKQPVKSTMPAEGNHKKGQKNGALEENNKSLPRSSSSSSSMPSENDSQSSTYVALKQFIESSLERVSTEFESVKSSLKDFDTQHANGRLTSASEFLSNSLDDVTKSLTKLKESSKTLLNSTSEVPMKAFSTGLAEAQQALDRLKTLTQAFDKNLEDSGVKQRVSELIEPTRKLATKYLTEISSYITELSKVAFAQLKGVNDALKQRFLSVSETGLQFTLKKAVELDQKFDFESKLKEIESRLEKSGIKENLQKLDEKYAIKSNVESALDFAKNKGKEIDEKWTEGKVTNIFEEAYEKGKKMVFQGLEKLQKEFDDAKLKQKGDTRVEN